MGMNKKKPQWSHSTAYWGIFGFLFLFLGLTW